MAGVSNSTSAPKAQATTPKTENPAFKQQPAETKPTTPFGHPQTDVYEGPKSDSKTWPEAAHDAIDEYREAKAKNPAANARELLAKYLNPVIARFFPRNGVM